MSSEFARGVSNRWGWEASRTPRMLPQPGPFGDHGSTDVGATHGRKGD
jgi:hypothetical protein